MLINLEKTGSKMTHARLSVGNNGGNTNEPSENPDPASLAWIQPGTFTMGSLSTKHDRDSAEGPQTQVTISNGFWMSKNATTQKEYLAVMGINPSKFKGDANRPVEMVSWYDATNYCAKLTAREIEAGRLPAGYEYRLPTNAEWEYACRAGTTTRFSYGDDLNYSSLDQYAWFAGNSANKTQPVGTKMPNAWGLYDMHGNVWEWCLDWHGTYHGGSVTDPRGPDTGSSRVNRGGSWRSIGGYCRSAFRVHYWPDNRDDFIGFRPVLTTGHLTPP
jgi:formylglycine-generating enzyme required for sulfatase activity